MGKTRSNHRAKTALIVEEINRGIEKLHDQIAQIDDLKRDGFPYRDAVRARAELQIRENIRKIFGDRSPEFQAHKNYKLRTSTKQEISTTLAMLQGFIATLEHKKSDLLGLTPAQPQTIDEPPHQPAPSPPPALSLVPPLAAPPPVTITSVGTASQPVTPPPVTMSVPLTTNIGMTQSQMPVPARAAVMPSQPVAFSPQSIAPVVAVPVTPPPLPVPPISHPIPSAVAAPPARTESRRVVDDVLANPPSADSSLHIPSPPSPLHIESPVATEEVGFGDSLSPSKLRPRTAARPATAAHVEGRGQNSISPNKSLSKTSGDVIKPRSEPARSVIDKRSNGDPMDLVRKLCLRFHTVARQLRLRREYRATLEVEDDYDVQDLFHALLRLEFDEIDTEDWVPSYTESASRTTFSLNRDGIAVLIKKTRPGVGAREIGEQLQVDAERYAAREACQTLFCFVYDPEGRIGNPRGLETDLTSISDHFTVE
ncbi:MAG: hypothetical protein ACT4OO_10050, partial [Nitrospiraceae bacterium]